MTTEPQDLRIKFELAPDEVARLQDHLAGGAAQKRSARSDTLTSTYFDTDELSLYETGVSLRLRNNGSGHHVQLVEFPNSATHYAADRVEWEASVTSDRPDFVLANGHAFPSALSEKVRNALKPVFKTRVKRTSHVVFRGSSEIGVTIDESKIDAGARSTAFSEVE